MANALLGSGSDLMDQARRFGIKGRSNMSVGELRDAVAEAVKTTAAPRGGAAAKARREMAAQEAPVAEPMPEEQTGGTFEDDLAEFQALLAQMDAPAAPEQPQAAQTMPAAPSYAMPMNRLLGGR